MKFYLFLLFIISNLIFADEKNENLNFSQIARDELKLQQRSNEKSDKTTATIKIKLPPIQEKIEDPMLNVGILLSPYKPKNKYQLDNFREFDYGSLPIKPIIRARMAWLPLSFKIFRVGPFLDISYARHNIALITQTGLKAKNTTLHSIITNVGLASEVKLNFYNICGGVNLGHSSTKFVQSSDIDTASLTSNSQAIIIGPYFKWKPFSNISTYFSFEYLKKLSSDDKIDGQNISFYVGLLGELD